MSSAPIVSNIIPLTPSPSAPKRMVNTVFKRFLDRKHMHPAGVKDHELTLAIGTDSAFTAAKHFFKDPITDKLTVRAFDAKKGFEFLMAHLQFSTIEDLFEIIRDVQDTPNAMILRGRVRDENPNGKLRRKLDQDGAKADLQEVDLAWFGFDLDSLDPASIEGWDWNDPCASLGQIFPHLNEGFGAIWQYSSSCKMRVEQVQQLDGTFVDKKVPTDDKIRGHVYVLLNRKVANKSLKQWIVRSNFNHPEELRFKSDANDDKVKRWSDPDVIAKIVAREPITRKVGGIVETIQIPLDIGGRYDQALCNAAQPHFVALPTFGEGVTDPIPQRLFLRSGPPVELPEWVQNQEGVDAAEKAIKDAHKAKKEAQDELKASQRLVYNRAAKVQSGAETWWSHLLTHLCADSRGTCLKVAGALKSLLGLESFEVFHSWCKTSEAYNSEAWCKELWRTAPTQETEQAIFSLAKIAIDDLGPEDDGAELKIRQITAIRSSGLEAFRAGNARDSIQIDFKHGLNEYHFDLSGPCYLTRFERDEDTGEVVEVSRQLLGRCMVPIAGITSVGMEDDERDGTRIKFRKGTAYVTADVPKGLSHSKTTSQNEVTKLTQAGLTVEPGSAWDLLIGLDLWHNDLSSFHNLGTAPTIKAMIKPGWQLGDKTYLNGDVVIGSDAYELRHDAREAYPAAKARGRESGTLDDWNELCKTTYTSVGLKALLAVSLAGASLKTLGLATWGIHMWGVTSVGKSTATCVASSVWGLADTENKAGTPALNLYAGWKHTAASFERHAQSLSDACFALDELGALDDNVDLAAILMSLQQGQGTPRSHEAWKGQMTWRVTLVSAGEDSLAVKSGGRLQSGNVARFLDIRCDGPQGKADWIATAEHAKQCKEGARSVYGVAGNAWVKILLDPTHRETLKSLHTSARDWLLARLTPVAGVERVAENAASALASLALASKTGVLPYSDDEVRDVFKWLRDAIENREVTSQENLSWLVVMSKVETTGTVSVEDLSDSRVRNGSYAVYSPNHDAKFTKLAFIDAAIKDLKLKTTAGALIAWAQANGFLGESPENRFRLSPGDNATQAKWLRLLSPEDSIPTEDLPPLPHEGLPPLSALPTDIFSSDPVPASSAELDAMRKQIALLEQELKYKAAEAKVLLESVKTSPVAAPTSAPLPVLAPLAPLVPPKDNRKPLFGTTPNTIWAPKTVDLDAAQYAKLEETLRAKHQIAAEEKVTIYLPSTAKQVKGSPALVMRTPLGVDVVLHAAWDPQTLDAAHIAAWELSLTVCGTEEDRLESLMEGLL